jgi:hypothetical protein
MSNVEDRTSLKQEGKSSPSWIDDRYVEVQHGTGMHIEENWGIDDKVNDLLPGGTSLFDESDESASFHDFGGEKVIDGLSETAGADQFLLEGEASEDSSWDLTPGSQNKSTDLVRLSANGAVSIIDTRE